MDILLILKGITALANGIKAVMTELKLPTTDFDTEMTKLQALIDTIDKNDAEWRKNHPI